MMLLVIASLATLIIMQNNDKTTPPHKNETVPENKKPKIKPIPKQKEKPKVEQKVEQKKELKIEPEIKPDKLEKIEQPKIEDKVEKKPEYLYGKILPKKGFEEAMLKLKGIQLPHAMEVSNTIRFKVDLRNLKAGEDFKVKLSKDGSKVMEFVYYPDIITFHILKRNPKTGKLDYTEKILPTEKRYRIIEGAVETSLNQALIDRDDVTGTIRAVTMGILECIVSFRTDARKGDKYRILIEENFYKGKRVPGAKILYTSYEGRRVRKKESFRYLDSDPKSAFNAHYTVNGKALIHDALRLPVDRVHVTSPFGMRRHPVTGRRKFHNGVDYGGPTGSPVYAVAKGKVIEVSQNRLGGKKIIIRHSDRTQTYYLHLHRQLVKTGQNVKPRQLIAKMGKTGRVTGPHLHFGIKSASGKWVNPLKKRMIATPKLKGKRMKSLKKQVKKVIALLKNTERYEELQRKVNEGPQPEDIQKELESNNLI